MARHSGFTNFTAARFIANCHTAKSSQKSDLCHLHLGLYSLRHCPRFMTEGDDPNKDGFKAEICGVWKLSFCGHRAMMLTKHCVYSSSPSINLFVLPSITRGREYHPKVLELLQLLQCNATHLQKTLPEFLGRHNTSVFLVLIFVLAWSHAAENQSLRLHFENQWHNWQGGSGVNCQPWQAKC